MGTTTSVDYTYGLHCLHESIRLCPIVVFVPQACTQNDGSGTNDETIATRTGTHVNHACSHNSPIRISTGSGIKVSSLHESGGCTGLFFFTAHEQGK
jgi:hypothetical protein